MSDQTTSVPAAEVATSAAAPAGETPPAKTREQIQSESAATLRAASVNPGDVDPLLDENPGGTDPLLDPNPGELDDPLAETIRNAPVEQEATTTEEEQPPDPDPEALAKVEAIKPPEADGRKRININRKREDGSFVYSQETRAAWVMSDELQIDFVDALDLIRGKSKPEAKEVEPTKVEPLPSSQEIDAKLKTLKAERKAAMRGLETEKADDIQEKIDDLIEQKMDAKQREADGVRHQQSAQQQFVAAESQSLEAVRTLNPDALTNGTEINIALNAEVDRMKQRNPDFFRDPEWPEIIYARVVMKEGLPTKSAAKPAPVVAKKPAPAPPPKKVATPIGAGGIQKPAPTVDPQAALMARLDAANKAGNREESFKISREIFAAKSARAA